MTIDLSKSLEVDAETGIVFTKSEVQKSAVISGDGSPVGSQAPLSTIYIDYTNAEFWQKVGPDSTSGETGWLKNGSSFANAADFQSFTDLGEDQTNNATFLVKLLETTGPKEGGTYYIGWFYEAGHTKKDNLFTTQLQIDYGLGGGWENVYSAPASVASGGTFLPIGGLKVLESAPANIAGYQLRMQFNELGTGTAKVKNLSIILYRLGD